MECVSKCLIVLAGVALLTTSACGPKKPPVQEFCTTFKASEGVNTYYQQGGSKNPTLQVWLYPLDSSHAFQEANHEDLLGGASIDGATGKPIGLRMKSNEVRQLNRDWPYGTTMVGIVADYFYPEGAKGRRSSVISADCRSFRNTVVVFSDREIVIE